MCIITLFGRLGEGGGGGGVPGASVREEKGGKHQQLFCYKFSPEDCTFPRIINAPPLYGRKTKGALKYREEPQIQG